MNCIIYESDLDCMSDVSYKMIQTICTDHNISTVENKNGNKLKRGRCSQIKYIIKNKIYFKD